MVEKTVRAINQIVYELKFPNLEVKMSLNDYLLGYLANDQIRKGKNQMALYRVFIGNDFKKMKQVFHSFFASIPNDWVRKNELAGYEGFYASIFYSYFVSLGFDVTPEDTTNHGRIDMTVKYEGRVYIFEFKVVEQIKEANTASSRFNKKPTTKNIWPKPIPST